MTDVEFKSVLSLVGVPETVKGLKQVGDSGEDAQVALDKVAKKAKDAGEAVKKTGKAAKDAGDDLTKAGKGAKDADAGLDQVGKSSRKAREGLDGVKTSAKGAGAGLGDTEKKSRTTATHMEALRKQFDQTGTSMRSAGRTMTTHVSMPLAAIAGLSFRSFANFDQTIRQVGSVADISGRQLDGMRSQALKLGKDTSFSASEAATAMLELAKGGISQAQMSAGVLANTLTLAAAGGLDLGEAAGDMTNTLNAFGLSAKDSAGVAAALAGGANASTASVQSLGQALHQVGAGAKQAGVDMNETVGVLAMFDQAGVKGSDAGTSLKTMLQRLVPQTKQASDAMKHYGLSFTDANGNFVTMADAAEQLKQHLGGLSEAQRTSALNTIFGSDASRAAAIMMEAGSAGVEKYTKSTMNLAAAQDLAKTNTTGAAGQIEQAKGSIETAAITLGQELAPKALAAAHEIQGLANGFTNLDSSSQNTIISLGMIAVAGGPALMALGSMASGAASAASGVRKLGSGFRTLGMASGLVGGGTEAAAAGTLGLSATLGPLALLLGGAGVAMYAYERHTKNQAKADEEWRQRGLALAPLIQNRKNAVDGLAAAQANVRKATQHMQDVEDQSGSKSAAYAAARRAVAAANERAAAAADRVKAAEKAVADNEGAGDGKGKPDGGASKGEEAAQAAAVAQTVDKITAAKQRLTIAEGQLRNQQQKSHENLDGVMIQSTSDKIKGATKELEHLQSQYDKGKISTHEFSEASQKQNHIIADAQRELKGLGKDVNDADSHLSKLRGQVLAAAGSLSKLTPRQARDLADALGVAGMSADDVRAKIAGMANTKPNLALARILLTEMSKGQRIAEFGTANINTILGRIGTASVSRKTWASFDQMMRDMRANSTVNVTVTTTYRDASGGNHAGKPANWRAASGQPAFARGGIIHGPGTGTSDSIPAMVSNGESIIPETSTRRNTALVNWMIDNPGQKVPLPGFKKGKKARPKAYAPADANKDGKVTPAEDASYQSRLAQGSKDAINSAMFDSSDLPADVKKKRGEALTALTNQLKREEEAKAKKAQAKFDLDAAKAREASLQKQYDAITGTNAVARKAALKPSLTQAKNQTKAKQTSYDNIVDTLRDGPGKRQDLAATIAGYDSSATSKAEDDARTAEDIRREALGLESQDEEAHRNAINAVRAANGMSLLERGDTLNEDGSITKANATSNDPDLAAQLAQAQQRAQTAESNQRISDQSLATLSGSGDIGTGGFTNALQAAGNGMQLHFHSAVPATVDQMRQVANLAVGGGQYNGTAAQTYTPVQQIGA